MVELMDTQLLKDRIADAICILREAKNQKPRMFGGSRHSELYDKKYKKRDFPDLIDDLAYDSKDDVVNFFGHELKRPTEDKLFEMIYVACQKANVKTGLPISLNGILNVFSIAIVESGFSARSYNFRKDVDGNITSQGFTGFGAFGIFQMVPSTWKGYTGGAMQTYANNWFVMGKASMIRTSHAQFQWAFEQTMNISNRLNASTTLEARGKKLLFWTYLEHWQGPGWVNSFKKSVDKKIHLQTMLKNITYEGFIQQMNKLFEVKNYLVFIAKKLIQLDKVEG